LALDVLWDKKATEILLVLLKERKYEREIQEAVGGNSLTISKRITQLKESGLIEEELSTATEYGEKTTFNKRLLGLTDEGHKLIESLVQSGVLKAPILRKEREKWIILLLDFLNGVRGKTRLMKLLFLMRFDVGYRGENFFRFKAFKYGPYSESVERDLKELKEDNLIYEKALVYEKGNCGEEVCFEYGLTAEGKKITKQILEDLVTPEREALEKLRFFNEMPLDNLLEYVYRKYPKFVVNSRIKKRILG